MGFSTVIDVQFYEFHRPQSLILIMLWLANKPSTRARMTDDDLEHYIIQRISPDLQQEGFDSSLEHEDEDDYITLTIHRRQRYY